MAEAIGADRHRLFDKAGNGRVLRDLPLFGSRFRCVALRLTTYGCIV
jgi:hypothetical protein